MSYFLQIRVLHFLPLGWALMLIPLLPLAGFLLLGLFGRKHIKGSSGIVGTLLLLGSTALSLHTAYGYFFKYGKMEGVYQKLMPLQYTWL